MTKNFNSFSYTENEEDIFIYIQYNSENLLKIFKRDIKHHFILFRKYLSHSDLVTKGKLGKGTKVGLSKKARMKCYKLYYQSVDELMNIWKNKTPPVAGQSNIWMQKDFYQKTKTKSYVDNNKKQADIVSDYGLQVFIPSDTCKDFNLEDLNKICEHNKKYKYEGKEAEDLKKFNPKAFLDEKSGLLKVDSLHIAAHGLGTDDDALFAYLRSFVFKGDVLNALYDDTDNILYLFFERNEKYYTLLNLCDNSKPPIPPIWREYSDEDKAEIVKTLCLAEMLNETPDTSSALKQELPEDDELQKLLKKYREDYKKSIDDVLASGEIPKCRWYQKKWKEVLIKADELHFKERGSAVCAISGIRGDSTKLGKFFVASHIKSYADCMNNEEYEDAFDPDNGLILCANIDALFDRHLITIDKSGKIIIKDVVKGIKDRGKYLRFKKLDKYYLNPNRLKYLKVHKAIFDSNPDK
ncbi:MAG: HNH endonuclease [Clostridia bacterium]|nr:HNH endonuclease [Clostridia bacterium]